MRKRTRKTRHSKTKLALLYTSFPSVMSAKKIVDLLLKQKLIACAHLVVGGVSTYTWKARTRTERETYCLLKTSKDCVPFIYQFMVNEHPYEVFSLIEISAKSLHLPYHQWMQEQLKI